MADTEVGLDKKTKTEFCTYEYGDGKSCTNVRNSTNDDYCILHLQNKNKDKKYFKKCFEEDLEKQKQSTLNFEGYHFPIPVSNREFNFDSRGIYAANARFYEDVDFRAHKFIKVDFRHCEFDKRAYFNNCIFRSSAHFSNVTFDSAAIFSGASFEKIAHFGETTFFDVADFEAATFQNHAYFDNIEVKYSVFNNSNFEEEADFRKSNLGASQFFRAKFNETADFGNASFKSSNFRRANFKSYAYFTETSFLDSAFFDKAIFEKHAHFKEAKFKNSCNFKDVIFVEGALFLKTDFFDKAQHDFDRARFNNSLFSDVDFPPTINLAFADLSKVVIRYSNVSCIAFSKSSGLNSCAFHYPLWLFTKNKLLIEEERQIINLENEGKEVGMDKYKNAEITYRNLRASYEKQNNFPDAGLFHYGEMEMRRLGKSSNRLKRTFLTPEGWYWMLSGYGEKWAWALRSFLIILLSSSLYYLWSEYSWTLAYHLPTLDELGLLLSDLAKSLELGLKITFLRLDSFAQVKNPTKLVMFIQLLFGPLTLALLGLAITRQFKRN